MNNFNEQTPGLEAEEIAISSETLGKTVSQLQEEEKQLQEKVHFLTQELAHIKNEDPADFTIFKKINGELRAHKRILEEVHITLAIKAREGAVKEEAAFNEAVEGEHGGALKKMDRRTGK